MQAISLFSSSFLFSVLFFSLSVLAHCFSQNSKWQEEAIKGHALLTSFVFFF
jgi:hypothetical protein